MQVNEKYTLVKPYQIEMINTHQYHHQCNLQEIAHGPSEIYTELAARTNNTVVERIRNYPEILQKLHDKEENKKLLNRLIDIGTGKVQFEWQKKFRNDTFGVYKKSMNSARINQEKKRVLLENNLMAQRITGQPATISRKKQLKESQKFIDMMKNVEKVPRARKMAKTESVNPYIRVSKLRNALSANELARVRGKDTATESSDPYQSPNDQLNPLDKPKNMNTTAPGGDTTREKTGRFRVTNNTFSDLSQYYRSKYGLDKNPHTYTIELIVNSISTPQNDLRKFRYLI